MSERRMWPTPDANAFQLGETPETWLERRAALKAKGYNGNGCGTPLAMAVQLPSAVPVVSNQLTLFAEAFPVSPIVSPADVAPPPTTATSGPSSPALFASLNPDGSWRKTCQGYSQMTLDGSLEAFSETWPRAGMTRNGTAYRLRPSAPLTDATASGSWPTPTGRDWKDGSATACQNVPANGLLGRVVHLPTPQATDYRTVNSTFGSCLRRADVMGPVERDLFGAIGGLNPTWVEWLMGFPLGWTDCADSVTPSSRKSRKSSAKPSSKQKRKG